MNLAKLDDLKQRLTATHAFKEVWSYFFDHFGEQPEFMQLGQRTEHAQLKQIIEAIGQQALEQENVSATNFLVNHIEEYQFYHGACFMNGYMITLIYFSDIDVGMAAIASFEGPTTFARFSCVTLDSEQQVFLAPTSNQLN